MAKAYVVGSSPFQRGIAGISAACPRIALGANAAIGGVVLVAVSLACSEAVKLGHIGVPSNALAIVATVLLLATGVVKPQTVDRASTFLVRHMTVFFAPLLLGVATAWATIAPHAAAFGVAWLVSVFAGLAAAGLCSQWVVAHPQAQHPLEEAQK